MSEYLEVKAKTIDEAIMKGLAQMDVSIDEVNIDIIEEGGNCLLYTSLRPAFSFSHRTNAKKSGRTSDNIKKIIHITMITFLLIYIIHHNQVY